MSAQFFSYQKDLSWHNNGVLGGYSFPVSQGRSPYLWAPLPHSPGNRRTIWKLPQLLKGRWNKPAYHLPNLFSYSERHNKELLLSVCSFSFSPERMIFSKGRELCLPTRWQDRQEGDPFLPREGTAEGVLSLTSIRKQNRFWNSNRLCVSGAEWEV